MNNINFRPVRKDLYSRFGDRVGTAVIDAILDDVIEQHTATARISDFLPVLIQREASERIEVHLWTHGKVGTPRQRILFASRTNAPRAALAAAIARRISDDAIIATVAKTHPENREDALIEWVMDERGLTAYAANCRTEGRRTLTAADIVVYLDSEEPHDLPGRTFVQWDVPATDGMSVEEARSLADDLEARVARLLTDLNIPVRALSEVQGEEISA